ncbi:P-loop containing nucleoside triphosphate hydrolase protein [Fusarium oxysporum Fo47]|uniref:P-loop containing nucleoside triphosphate hydrolase protein n=1 Tax=Fusarium oxysporum Fo47 TaxID=660027 RepID=UPI0028699EE3|nr:P-loop containing nucleoside triphosphate hydrolase protein [Fusarium oxysporum Fo47]QKD58056.2 P-loop containing nucleoside triphosphate hydrolase protein [Fusarium oxysporum Fo47]
MASHRQILCNLIIREVTDEGTPKLVHLRSSSNFIISLNTKGIRISFPRDPDRSIWSWYSADLATTDSALYHITIELPPRGFTATHHELTVKHNELLSGIDGELSEYRLVDLQISPHYNTTVIGFGLPFHGANATVDDWVNKHTPIAGVAPLSEILKTRNFTFLVKASKNDLDNMIKGINDRHQRSDYGYGTESTFKMFGTFITTWNMSTMLRCRRLSRRLATNPSNMRPVEFLPNRSRQLVTWDASPVIYGDSELPKDIDSYDRIPLVLLRPDTGDGHDFSPIAHDKYEQVNEELERDRVKLICESNAYGEELRVQAINRLSDAKVWPTMQQDTLALNKKAIFNELLIGNGLWNLHHSGSNIDLTPFDLFKDMPVEIRDTCLGFVFEGDRGKVQQYFSKLHFGLGIVSGPPGTGKSTLASAITVLMCLNQTIKHVYVSATSNEATDNILDRIDTLAKSIIKKLTEDGISANQLMVVRGYRIKDEQDKCLRALTGLRFKPGPRSSSAWRFKNSLCWWTLRVLGSSAVPQLTPSDNSELWELHQKLKELLVPGAVKDPNISEFAGLLKLAEELDPKKRTKYSTGTYQKPLRNLMGLVIKCSNVVATTPATSNSFLYRSYNSKVARGVIFDEAATLFCSDGLLVLGNTPRPMIMFGDTKQLAPVLPTAMELLHTGKDRRDKTPEEKKLPTNRFANFYRISWFHLFIHLGWPVFNLYRQHRMAQGLFDLSLRTAYRHLLPHFEYSPYCELQNFPIGTQVENYLRLEHHIPSAGAHRIDPVFFNCLNCPCRNYPHKATRFNPRQADLIAELLVKMIEKLSLNPADIAVITYYRANLAAIRKRFREDDRLKDVTPSTVNTFQGREAQIVVLALCVTRETGPSFVAEQRSLNVALTRQKSSLLIFGDIDTTNIRFSDLQEEDKADDGLQKPDSTMIDNVLRTIRASRRVVTLHGNPEIDPDKEWKKLNRQPEFLG